MNKYMILALATATSVLTACSSSSDGGSSTVNNLVTETYAEVLAQATKAAGDGEALASGIAVRKSIVPFAAPDFGNAWDTTPSITSPIDNTTTITVKEFMGIQLDPTALNSNNSSVNVFGRLDTALKIFCAVGVGAGMAGVDTDTNGYPENGSHTITFSAAVKNQMDRQCGMDVSDIPNGETMVMTVTDSSGSYDKSFAFDSFNQVYLVKSTSTDVNIATGEVHDNGTSVSRTVVLWNKVTNVLRAQYVSDPGNMFTPGNSGLYAYRMYFDETNDEAQIFTYEGPDNNASQATRYILAGKPSTGDALSLSFLHPNVESGSTVEACANSATGDLFDDGARCAAGGLRLNGAAIDAVATANMITDFYDDRGDSTWATVTGSTTLPWSSMSDMLTVNIDP